MSWVAARMQEKSSWAGLLGLVSLILHTQVSGDLGQSITQAGMAAGALLAMILKENGS
jgi:hypothetical protein